MSDNQSLDSFLEAQGRASNRATLERIDKDHVKVTPWVAGVGCLCHLAFKVPVNTIELHRPTGECHSCCGKEFDVVKIQWVKGSSILIEELFSQVAATISTGESDRSGGVFKPQPQPWRQARGGPFDEECVAECARDCGEAYPGGGSGYWRCLAICDRVCRRR